MQVSGEDEIGRGRLYRVLGQRKGVGPLRRGGPRPQGRVADAVARESQRIGQPAVRDARTTDRAGPRERDDRQAAPALRQGADGALQQHRPADPRAGMACQTRPRCGRIEAALSIQAETVRQCRPRPEHLAAGERLSCMIRVRARQRGRVEPKYRAVEHDAQASYRYRTG